MPSSRRRQLRRSYRPYLKSKTNRALLNFVQEAAQATIKTVNLYSFFLNYQRAILRHGLAYAHDLKEINDRRALQHRLRELKRQRFIKARRIGSRIELKLTGQGKIAVYLDRLRRQPDTGAVATLVIFDVPETERSSRRQFRFFLKQAGFKKIQQSAWWRQADVYETVQEFIKYLQAERWIAALRTTDRLRR